MARLLHMCLCHSWLIAAVVLQAIYAKSVQDYEDKAKVFIDISENNYAAEKNKHLEVSWNYWINMTQRNRKDMEKSAIRLSRLEKQLWKNVTKLPWNDFKDEDLRRRLKMRSNLGENALPEKKLTRYLSLLTKMQTTYSTARLCNYGNGTNCDLTVEDTDNILRDSQDPEERKHYWLGWRRVAGQPIRRQFTECVKLTNQMARLNNFSNGAEYWASLYPPKDLIGLKDEVSRLLKDVQPLFRHLHAYVRRRLYYHYGAELVGRSGPIPAHLLGDVWARSWEKVAGITAPFPGKASTDVTESLRQQKFTPLQMAGVAEDFLASLNLSKIPKSLWNMSIFERRPGVNMSCEPSAWDFLDGKDFRILACVETSSRHLSRLLHQTGLVQHFVEYRDQPVVYRRSEHPGFGEAVGGLLAMAAQTPRYLQRLRLLPRSDDDDEVTINHLYALALRHVAVLPYAVAVDSWRWSVLKGVTKSAQYSCNWWKLRQKLQGLSPPAGISEDDFDLGSDFYVAKNIPYTRIFLGTILQFQIHRHLCTVSGRYEPSDPRRPLHNCDLYGSVEAGAVLKNVMSMGSSRPWPEILQSSTGTTMINASAIREYFAPLEKWLRRENKRTGETVGWTTAGSLPCSPETAAQNGGSGMQVAAVIFLLAATLHLWQMILARGRYRF